MLDACLYCFIAPRMRYNWHQYGMWRLAVKQHMHISYHYASDVFFLHIISRVTDGLKYLT